MLSYCQLTEVMERTLKIVEIFQSLQGEGANTGKLVIFIRLTGCNLNCSFCDTDFGHVALELTPHQLLKKIEQDFPNCHNIIWTGGEPTLQLTEEIVALFKSAGYWQALESNGLKAAPKGLDYITLSPKERYDVVKDNYHDRTVGEVRLPIAMGDNLLDLDLLPSAEYYFISPIFDGENIVQENIEYCYQLISQNPIWRLSLQIHKLIGIR